tara:strand:+ start:899 stop:1054 length:156 start_codon:yes stop_codon:yes gene_type:complete
LKVYEPNKAESEIRKALVLLEALKSTVDDERVGNELLKIRRILLEAKEHIE